jgi:hypothetical protein
VKRPLVPLRLGRPLPRPDLDEATWARLERACGCPFTGLSAKKLREHVEGVGRVVERARAAKSTFAGESKQ